MRPLSPRACIGQCRALIASGLLTEEERILAIKARDDDQRNFEKGYDTVAAHGRLTETGRIALDAARAYMRKRSLTSGSSAGNGACR